MQGKGILMADTKNRVRTFIAENFLMGANAAKVSDADSFQDLHILDSTGFLELVSFLEQEFSIRVKDEEMIPENLDSLDNIDSYLERKLHAG